MVKVGREWQKRIARRLRQEGWVYRAIAEIFSVDRQTASTWCDEKIRVNRNNKAKRHKERNWGAHMARTKKWKRRNPEKHKEIIRKCKEKKPGRYFLITAHSGARRGGYMPPDITEEQYEELKKNHGGLCDLCGRPPKFGKSKQSLHLDHCHDTGEVRGFLCVACNHTVGHYEKALRLGVPEYLTKGNLQ